MSFLGLSFGSKTQKTDQLTDINKTDTVNQQQTGTKSQTGTVDTTSSQTGQSTTSSSQTQNQAGTNKTTGTQEGVTTSKTSAFSDPILQGIESVVTEMFGKVGGAPKISDFNVDDFVKNGLTSARSDITDRIDSEVNQLMHGIGGAAGSNSMQALLGNKLRNTGAAQLAGIEAELTKTGEGIARDNTLAENALAGQDQNFLGQLLAQLKGGSIETTGTESVKTATDQQTQSTGTTTGTESTASAQQSQSSQTQNLLEQLNQLLNGTTTTVGTEATKGKTKSSGGGFSLAI